MGIKISVWAAAGVAFGISFAGTALFFVAARQLKQAAAKESGSESDTETKKDQDPYQYPYKNTAKWWQAGMYVGNVAAAAALTVVCQEDLFTVLKMLCLCMSQIFLLRKASVLFSLRHTLTRANTES